MSEKINAMVIDLSHWDPANDYKAIKNDGIVGVIYKATQGTNYPIRPVSISSAQRSGVRIISPRQPT